ncbi:MAG TPA: redoxin domain-containing protein [Planctomycetota bacterium]|nr:redoxin domain-containing protein [Planctomycetota bacterium]
MNVASKLALLSLLVFPVPAQEPAPEPAKPAPEQPKVLQLGDRVKGELALLDIDGVPQKAGSLMGKITVVNFYSIQCPIQAGWDQRLAQIQKDFEGDGVVFLHIDSNVSEIGAEPPPPEQDIDAYAKVRSHLKEKQLPFRVLVDHGNKVADLFDAKTTPHVYVFGNDGRLVYKGLVDDDPKDRNADSRSNYLRDVLGKLTKGEKVEPFTTKEQGCSIKRVSAGRKPGGRRRGGDQGGKDGGE